MNTISNDVRIKLLCELAHKRILNKINQHSDFLTEDMFIIEDEFGSRYTEYGQEIFNEYYDYYEKIILDNLELVEDHNYKQREEE